MSTSWRKGMDTTAPFVAPYQERENPRTVRSELSDSGLPGAWIRLDLTKLLIPFCTKLATSVAARLLRSLAERRSTPPLCRLS